MALTDRPLTSVAVAVTVQLPAAVGVPDSVPLLFMLSQLGKPVALNVKPKPTLSVKDEAILWLHARPAVTVCVPTPDVVGAPPEPLMGAAPP